MAPKNIRINPLGGAVCIALVLVVFFYMFGADFFTAKVERISMKELLSTSVVLARRGGERVKAIRRSDTLQAKVKGETKEGANEMVSQGDMQSHEAIFYGFAKAFPGLNVVSEEHENTPVDFAAIPDINKHLPEIEKIVTSDQSIPLKDITVWIDPLDATQEYTEKIDKDKNDLLHYVTVMVCVAVNGQPRIGVIHKPFANKDDGETTWAWVSYGQSQNLVKETHQAKTAEDPHRIIVSRAHAGPVKAVAEKALGADKVSITPAGGAGYKTLEVIKGKQDAYIHSTLIKKWDICAGNAILSAVEGKMTTLDGKYIDYSNGNAPKNEGGLLSSVYNHQMYLDSLAKGMKKE